MRANLMDWKKSTTPSVFNLSSWAWIQMKVPVRPTPSLQRGRTRQMVHYVLTALMNTWSTFNVVLRELKSTTTVYSNNLQETLLNAYTGIDTLGMEILESILKGMELHKTGNAQHAMNIVNTDTLTCTWQWWVYCQWTSETLLSCPAFLWGCQYWVVHQEAIPCDGTVSLWTHPSVSH